MILIDLIKIDGVICELINIHELDMMKIDIMLIDIQKNDIIDNEQIIIDSIRIDTINIENLEKKLRGRNLKNIIKSINIIHHLDLFLEEV